MPNKNYVKGRNKEYKVMKRLRDEGYDVVARTAGSHGVFDVIAFNKETKDIKLIQCKPASMSDNARRKIIDENSWLIGSFFVTFTVE